MKSPQEDVMAPFKEASHSSHFLYNDEYTQSKGTQRRLLKKRKRRDTFASILARRDEPENSDQEEVIVPDGYYYEDDGMTAVGRYRNKKYDELITERMQALRKAKGLSEYGKVDIDVMEDGLREKGILSDQWNIHSVRTRRDPLYMMLFFPRTLLLITDETTHETREVSYMNKMINDAIEFLKKRYGSPVSDDAHIKRGFDYILHTQNPTIKCFALFWMITIDENIRGMIQELHGSAEENEDPSLCFRSRADIDRVLSQLPQWVNQTMHFPFGVHNVASIVKNFCASVRKLYMTPVGPYRRTR